MQQQTNGKDQTISYVHTFYSFLFYVDCGTELIAAADERRD